MDLPTAGTIHTHQGKSPLQTPEPSNIPMHADKPTPNAPNTNSPTEESSQKSTVYRHPHFGYRTVTCPGRYQPY